MAKISLKKGSTNKISLKKSAPLLRKIRVEFSWTSNSKLDLDASALLCRKDSNGAAQIISEKHMVFYAQGCQFDQSKSVFYGGDVRDGSGDKETIEINLETLPSDIEIIPLILSIDDPRDQGLTFGNATGGLLKIINAETDEEILDFDFLADDLKNLSIIHVANIEVNGGDWNVEGVGVGGVGGILDAFMMFGASADWFE